LLDPQLLPIVAPDGLSAVVRYGADPEYWSLVNFDPTSLIATDDEDIAKWSDVGRHAFLVRKNDQIGQDGIYYADPKVSEIHAIYFPNRSGSPNDEVIKLPFTGPATFFRVDGARNWFVAGSRDGRVALYLNDHGTLLMGHTKPIRDADLSPDTDYLCTASEDGTARVWRLRDGASLVLGGYNGAVLAARFTRDGKEVVSVGADGRAYRWKVSEIPEPAPLARPLDATTLGAIMPRAKDPGNWATLLNAAMRRFEINSADREAMFLAGLAFKTDGLTSGQMRMNIGSADVIHQMWPGKFPSVESAKPYVNNGIALANRAFANERGNRGEASGDGWRYLPRGYIQDRDEYRAAGEALRYPYEQKPELVAQPADLIWTSAWYWSWRNFNALADKGQIGIFQRQKLTEIWSRNEIYNDWQRARKVLHSPPPAGSAPL